MDDNTPTSNVHQQAPTEDRHAVADDSAVAKTVNLIIEQGVKAGATDIHIEPRENFVVVRYRIDGIMREANKLPLKELDDLLVRIKQVSDLKVDEKRAPQDGRFKLQVGGSVYGLRVSTLPIVDGEKVVLRILNESTKPATFAELGFWGEGLKTLQQAIIQPHGLIVVTGPTGAGKSTTLYSILSVLNTPSVTISTVEDPIEYRIPGANQTQVNPFAGMSFSNGLRALLRQDPNVVMVGDIRDSETADVVIQAAQRGHLVFSSMHTLNGASCIGRLLTMNVEPFLIASTVRAVVGQRLARQLCVQCRQEIQPDEAMSAHIKEAFDLLQPGQMKRLNELEAAALQAGIGGSTTPLSSSDSGILRLWKAQEDGCESCSHTGYNGRIGICEVLGNSDEVAKLIANSCDSEVLEHAAEREGMVTMKLDGLVKALRGETTVDEVLRVVTT